MSRHITTFDEASQAIDTMFADRSVAIGRTRQNLEALKEQINAMLMAIKEAD